MRISSSFNQSALDVALFVVHANPTVLEVKNLNAASLFFELYFNASK